MSDASNMMTKFNLEELRRVADCLRVINPARCPNTDSTMKYIAGHGLAQLQDKPGYVETMGFCVTCYLDHVGNAKYKTTLSSYGVALYIALNGDPTTMGVEVTTDGNHVDNTWRVEVGNVMMTPPHPQYIAQHEYDIMVDASKDPKSSHHGKIVTLWHGITVVRSHIPASRKQELEP